LSHRKPIEQNAGTQIKKNRGKAAFCKGKIKLSTRESLGYLGKTAVFPFFTGI
jgi:hypothetical protein